MRHPAVFINMATVLIFVHSFIRRLEQSLGHVDGCFHNLIVYSALCTISFYGTDGGRLDFFRSRSRAYKKNKEIRIGCFWCSKVEMAFH